MIDGSGTHAVATRLAVGDVDADGRDDVVVLVAVERPSTGAIERQIALLRGVEATLAIVPSGRPDSTTIDEVRRHVAWGPGPRASQALMLAARGRAVLDGRLAPSIDDVVALAHPVLRHRMALNFAARAEGVTLDSVIDRLCAPHR